MTTDNHNGWYTTAFKNWPKQAGSKPSGDLLATVHGLGLRPGKQAMANAMALRPEGVSGSQIVMVCGAPQLNRMRGLIASGVVKREAVAPNELGHAVYKITLTKRGEGALAKSAAAQAKAVAGKPAKAELPAKVKAAKAKVKAAKVAVKTAKAELTTAFMGGPTTPQVEPATPTLPEQQ